MRTVREIDGEVVYDNGDPSRPEYDATIAADATDDNTLRQQVASRLPKARAIIADPAGAPDWTPVERKTILALALIDLARRYRWSTR